MERVRLHVDKCWTALAAKPSESLNLFAMVGRSHENPKLAFLDACSNGTPAKSNSETLLQQLACVSQCGHMLDSTRRQRIRGMIGRKDFYNRMLFQWDSVTSERLHSLGRHGTSLHHVVRHDAETS